jgi:hypothetical protein
MKARNLIPRLQKPTSVETEVVVAVDGKEYPILDVTDSIGKKIIVLGEPEVPTFESDSTENTEDVEEPAIESNEE